MTKIRVLLVEDEEYVRHALKTALELSDMEVETAETGSQAVRADISRFDIIVTDILMPDGDGMEILNFVQERNLNVPVIVISGGGRISSENYLLAAQGLGAAAVFQKPLDERGLIAKIRELKGH